MPRRRRSLLGGAPRLHHRVYCIELHPAVRRQARFRRQNPDARYDATCLYVGSTGLEPEARFENHLRGHKGCPLVRTYGVRLRPDLFAFNAGLHACVRAGKPERVSALLRRMEAAGVPPDAATATIAAKAGVVVSVAASRDGGEGAERRGWTEGEGGVENNV
jgi:pentatricopeptide repeat protein